MKVVYKFLAFLLLAASLGSCFDPPVFPMTPEIEFEDIYFGETPDFREADSIVISINFKDGNGNIGIDKIITANNEFIDNINDPFHDSNFYLSTGGTNLKEVGTETFYTDTFPNGVAEYVPIKILSTRNQSGKLLTLRNQAGYTGLPAYRQNKLECVDYTTQPIFIFQSDWDILDNSYYIKDTLLDAFGNRFITVRDTLYFQHNPNHYTIEVDFLLKQPAHPNADADGFREYDWWEEFCQTYDGRFSRLSDTETPLEGTIKYAMVSVGFKYEFGSVPLKLRVSIKDRDLNVSNVIYTPEFTLEKIKR